MSSHQFEAAQKEIEMAGFILQVTGLPCSALPPLRRAKAKLRLAALQIAAMQGQVSRMIEEVESSTKQGGTQ
jgi:hypothetical protein